MERINYVDKKGSPHSLVVANISKGKKYYSYNVIGLNGRRKSLISKTTIMSKLDKEAPTLDNNAIVI